MSLDRELIAEFRDLWITINVDDELTEFLLRDISLIAEGLKSRGYAQDPEYPTKWVKT